jgi:cupin 2 domain-containing protein
VNQPTEGPPACGVCGEEPAERRFFFDANKANLFDRLPSPASGEVFEALLRYRNLVIERIVSSDNPEPGVYDQEQDEWVLLVQGQATLELAGETLSLGPGDHLFIPAHTRHRVLRTSQKPPCLWVAVHLFPGPASD